METMEYDEKQIEEIFKNIFNGNPNPIFSRPIAYFQYKNYLFEIAKSPSKEELDWNRVKKNPLHVFDAMFVDQGYYATVLKIVGEGEVETTDLSDHISSPEVFNSLDNIDAFLNKTLN